jgi:hypothetical protein
MTFCADSVVDRENVCFERKCFFSMCLVILKEFINEKFKIIYSKENICLGKGWVVTGLTLLEHFWVHFNFF